jgi:hypothetical protein
LSCRPIQTPRLIAIASPRGPRVAAARDYHGGDIFRRGKYAVHHATAGPRWRCSATPRPRLAPHATGLQGPHPGRGQLRRLKVSAGGRQVARGLCTPREVSAPNWREVSCGAAAQACSRRARCPKKRHAGSAFSVAATPLAQDNSNAFVGSVEQLHETVGKYVAAVEQQAERIEAEKLRAVGLRNRAAALHEVGCTVVLDGMRHRVRSSVHRLQPWLANPWWRSCVPLSALGRRLYQSMPSLRRARLGPLTRYRPASQTPPPG